MRHETANRREVFNELDIGSDEKESPKEEVRPCFLGVICNA